MSKVLDNLRKKHGFPVEIDGETYHVRPLTFGEMFKSERLFPIDAESEATTLTEASKNLDARLKQSFLRTAYMVGCVLCTGVDGEPAFPRQPDQSIESWVEGVNEQLADVENVKLKQLLDAAGKLGLTSTGQPVSVETLAKN